MAAAVCSTIGVSELLVCLPCAANLSQSVLRLQCSWWPSMWLDWWSLDLLAAQGCFHQNASDAVGSHWLQALADAVDPELLHDMYM